MPFHRKFQSDPLTVETRLCFAAAGGCLLFGLSGWTLNRFTELHVPSSAFVVVGVFYGVMGLGRIWKMSHAKPGGSREHARDHKH